ncbi:T9SS type A sorting domain-containing protein [Bacteroidota bacterium]
MTKIYLIIMVIFINTISVVSQIPTWPPGGLQPSPYQLMLPGDRFVPSTSRYNLVWADLIVPSWVTVGQVEFAAKNYVGTQKIWADQIAQFREHNPNFLGLIYHLAVGLNPEDNSECPDPKNNATGNIGVVSPAGYVPEWSTHFLPWLADKGIEVGSDRFESMFQHYDEFDADHRVWHKDPYWLMNMKNEDWSDYLIDQCNSWMEGNSDEGCFFDVSVEPYAYLYCPNQYAPEPVNFDWWKTPHKPYNSDESYDTPSDYAVKVNELYLKYYQKIYSSFHRATVDYLVIPNVDQMITTVYDPVWMDGDDNGETIDGAMIEGFGGATGQDMYLTLERTIHHITGRGKILIAQFNADTPEERYRRTAMYMLIKNENSFININPQEVGWYPEYEIDLGEQTDCPETLEELRVKDWGGEPGPIFKRDYEYGYILWNNDELYLKIKPTGEYYLKTSGGGEVNEQGIPLEYSIDIIKVHDSVWVAPSDCIILYDEEYVDVKEIEKNKAIMTFYPNPANEFINVKINNYFREYEIRIYNALGNMQLTASINGSGKQRIDIRDLIQGVYFIQIRIDEQIINKQFTIVR